MIAASRYSLAYCQPVIDELLVHPMPDDYLEYLRPSDDRQHRFRYWILFAGGETLPSVGGAERVH
jgi:hypothetical protein